MSAIGPKRTSASAPHVSVLGGLRRPIPQLRLATSFDNAVGEASSKNEVPNAAGNDGLRDPAHERNLFGCRPIPRISASECGAS